MPHLSDTDRLPQHQAGERLDVRHACPDCPSPLAGGVARFPNPFCPWCYGTGLLTTAALARWQAAHAC